MDNNITIESLKRKFYLQGYFSRYCEYLEHRNFEDENRLNRALDIALTDGDGKKYYGSFFGRDYDRNKKEYGTYLCHNIKISESQIWASVEEFFDILNGNGAIDELEGLRKHIYSLLEFIKTDDPKNPAVTKQMSEDTIIRLIVKHFWKENPVEDIQWDFVSPIFYAKDAKIMFLDSDGVLKEDSADRRKKYQRVVRPFSSANEILDKATYDSLISITEDRLIDKRLNEDFKQVISYLKAIKKIRNNQAHHISNTVTEGANKVFEFCLFVYLHLVLTLRKALILRGKGEYHQQEPTKFRVYIDAPNPSLDVKLFKLVGDNEIEIGKDNNESNSQKIVFDVEYYVNYKLAVNDQREIKTEFVYNSLSPHAYIHALGEPEIRHCAEDSPDDNSVLFGDLLKEISRTSDNIEDIRVTNRAILEKQGEQVEILIKEREDRIKREKAVARNLFLFAMFVIMAVLLYFAIRPSHKESQNILTIDKIADFNISSGDSLLHTGVWQRNFDKCKQAGEAYRAAIGQLRDRAEQMDCNSSIALCHLYLSGKGCYDLDSAFYFAQRKEVRATKEGQGLYAYILIKREEFDAAGREVSRAIDTDEPYICLTRALYKIYDATNNVSSLQTSKQICESAYQSLDNINNDDARYEKALLSLWGVRNREDTEFLIHPHFGKAYNALLQLSGSYPISLLSLGDVHNIMGDPSGGLNYHCAAFYCGIQQKAAVAINLSMLLNAETFKLTELGRTIKEKMTGMANVIGGVGGLLSNYIHYMEDNKYDWAIRTADSLYVLTHGNSAQDINICDTAYISSMQISSRLMTGKAEEFSQAVHLAMIRDNCSDSIAVSDYLKGVCFAKGYSCMKDLKKSDELILSSAQRGTYTESLATNILRNPPLHGSDIIPSKLLNHYFNPELLRRSPKLVSAIGNVFLTSDAKYCEEYDISNRLVPYFPQLWNLMNNAFLTYLDKSDNYKIKKTHNTDEKEFEEINDYICLAMRGGLSYLAQNGCLLYKTFASTVLYQPDAYINAYQKFSLKKPELPKEIETKIENKDFNSSDLEKWKQYDTYNNILPLYPVYAF